MVKRRAFLKNSFLGTTGILINRFDPNIRAIGSIIPEDKNKMPSKYLSSETDFANSQGHLADKGWCWDGQAINGQWQLSIFGAGEGTKWFGLKRCCFMFHPNTALAMEKLRDMKEIVCDISKWEYRKVENTEYKGLEAPVRMYHDGSIRRKSSEAESLSLLSRKFPNITGAFDDDLYSKIKTEHITPQEYAEVHKAVKRSNPEMKHWGVVYSYELDKKNWVGFTDLLDVINLWVWESKDLVNLNRYIDQCHEVFPGKAIIIGCYLRDFTILDGVPMDLLKHQWELVLKSLLNGSIQGYSILGGFLIDIHPEQAIWVRDFIKAN